MIKFNFIPHFAIRIVCAFIFFTAIGTLTHEFGHLAVAEYFGYETKLSYGSVHFEYKGFKEDPLYLEYRAIFDEHKEDLEKGVEFPAKSRYLELLEMLKEKYPRPKPNSHWVTLGGPAQTILTSLIGLFILFYRKSRKKEFFVLLDWLGVFLALFILREVFNFVMSLFSAIFSGRTNFYSDEFRLSRHFGMNQWIVPAIGLSIGMIISLYVIFRVIPVKYRFTFILSGLVGGILGFLIWLEWLGPVILP